MDILFLLVGGIIGLLIPILKINILGGKIALFIGIMVVFFIFVLAYCILSIYKYFIAKLKFITDSKIVSWDNGYKCAKKPLYKHFIFCGIFGLIVGIILLTKEIDYISALLSAVGSAFVSFGWIAMGEKRLYAKKSEIHGFFLSHIGLIYNGKAEIFNGTTKGILSAKEKNGYLILEILRKKQTDEIKIAIPEDNKEDVQNFLADMKEFFNGKK